jgi:hypothetical protein
MLLAQDADQVNGEIGGDNLLRDFGHRVPFQLLVGAFQPARFVRRFIVIESRRVGWIDGSERIVHNAVFGFFFGIGIAFYVHSLGCFGHAWHLYRLRCQSKPRRLRKAYLRS